MNILILTASLSQWIQIPIHRLSGLRKRAMRDEFLTVQLDAALQNAASTFDCVSAPVFNSFIRSYNAIDSFYGKTFVFPLGNTGSIIGYYNIGIGEVLRIEESRILKCGGAIYINYLALDKRYRGQPIFADKPEIDLRWSDLLLRDCLRRIDWIRQDHVGFGFVTLSASKEGYNLYKRHGFLELAEDEMYFVNSDDEMSGKGIQMYLPLDIE